MKTRSRTVERIEPFWQIWTLHIGVEKEIRRWDGVDDIINVSSVPMKAPNSGNFLQGIYKSFPLTVEMLGCAQKEYGGLFSLHSGGGSESEGR